MRIAVCVKQVPNSNQIKVDPVTHNLIRENVEMVVNPADMNALTEAIQIKNTIGGTVDVFTMGVKEADNILYTALAVGADQAYLVTDRDFAGCDSYGTALVLSEAIQAQKPYDLVLCGCLASDGATGQVGSMLAEFMQRTSLSMIKSIEKITDREVTVTKSFRGKKMTILMKLPCVLTVSLGANSPLLPTLRNQMKAKKKEIHVLTNEDLQIFKDKIGTQGAMSLVTNTYPVRANGKESEMLSADAAEAAAQIKAYINREMEK